MTKHHLHTHVRRQAPLPGALRESGLSLIELMISITLGLLILAGVISVFANTSATRIELERMSRQIENGRYATDLLSTDLQMAGFFGEFTPTTPAAVPDPCSTAVADWGVFGVHVQGIDNYVGGTLSCLPADVRTGTDVLVVRRAKPCAATAGSTDCPLAADKPYVQVALCTNDTESALPPIVALSADATGSNFNLHKGNCTTLADMRPYVLRIYYVSTNNGSGQNVPTLKRAEFNGAGFTITELVEGIEDMQIEYGVDFNSNGKVDVYKTASVIPGDAVAAAITAAAGWNSVLSVRINLLARNIDPSTGFTDAKTYGNGLTPMSVGELADTANYRRHAYSALVKIQNVSGRRDTP